MIIKVFKEYIEILIAKDNTCAFHISTDKNVPMQNPINEFIAIQANNEIISVLILQI